MESEILQCVHRNDVKGLKSFKDHPNLSQIRDASGRTILQIAIDENKIAVFKFLLSLDSCLTNTRNSEGETVLEVALSFCMKRLKENKVVGQTTFFLHDAINYKHIEVAKLLIEKGADVNRQNYIGNTPLHMVYRLREGADELLSMMLCFGGADLSIPNSEGLRPIDFTFLNEDFEYLGHLSELVQEHLVFYFFDDYSTGYDIPLGNLFGLLQSDYSFVPQVLKHITSVNLENLYYCGRSFYFYFQNLFMIKPEYLKLLLEKFDYAIEYIINGIFQDGNAGFTFSKKAFIENFDLLLQSRFGLDLIQLINKTRLFCFMEGAEAHSHSEYFNCVLLLLSYGAIISDEEVEQTYQSFGDCEFFRTLLHMDIKFTPKCDEFPPDLMPALFYDIDMMDVETFVDGYHYYGGIEETMEELLDYFAHPKVKDYCRSKSIEEDIVNKKIKNLPTVPLLVELARDKVREFLIEKYEIKNSMQFYTLVKHLPISKVHEKIITLETKLYENYHK